MDWLTSYKHDDWVVADDDDDDDDVQTHDHCWVDDDEEECYDYFNQNDDVTADGNFLDSDKSIIEIDKLIHTFYLLMQT